MAGPDIRVGTSGWNYWHWTEKFFPRDLPRNQWLAHYQKQFDTVELNASFYRMVRASTFARWHEASPEGFLWSVKAQRSITHFTRLAEREPLKKFLASVEGLGDALGVILFQLPPSLKFETRLVGRFLGWLPAAAGKRYAVEPRHQTWFEPKAIELLRDHGVALCIAESGGRFPSGEYITAGFVYLRFHGGEQLYASRYTLEQIRTWAKKLVAWKRPAFVYFNNDFEGYAVENALELKHDVAKLRGETPRRARAARAGTR